MSRPSTGKMTREEEERRELEAILESGILKNAPNLQRFLEFIADRHFEGTADQVKEYSIAVHALHRPEQFDPQADAIVRVSAHALRRKLEQFYSGEGSHHPVQVCLPAGKYILQFTRNHEGHSDTGDASVSPSSDESVPPTAALAPLRTLRWKLWAAVAAGMLLLLAALAHWRREAAVTIGAAGNVPGPAASQDPPIRIHLGESGKPYVDVAGQTWVDDQFCQGGSAFSHPGHPIQGSDDSLLFEEGRQGKFHCAIPVPQGTYQVQLLFADTAGDQVGARQVVYSINNGPEQALDVVDEAGGNDVAVGKMYAGIHPGGDGSIHLDFLSDGAFINAIEIMRAPSDSGLPLRMVAGPVTVRDEAGNTWFPERFFAGGRRTFHPENLPAGPNPRLFQWSRYGHFEYHLPVPPRHEYTVSLYFSENWFGPANGGPGGVGSRVFDVYCNGTVLLRNFDILREQTKGGVIMTSHHVRPTAHGMLDLYFTPIENYSLVNAIEVEAEN